MSSFDRTAAGAAVRAARPLRRGPRRRRLAACALALLPFLAAPPAWTSPQRDHRGSQSRKRERREAREAMRSGDFEAPTIGWQEGPVRYILSHDEVQAYRALDSREERARFIQRFWTRRDPDPSTPENEYRTLFYRRVDMAQRLFRSESTKPGWKTDRGKILILLGPPDEFDAREYRAREDGVILWTYRDPPPGSSASPNTTIRFVRDPSGEYRLTTGVRLFSSETAMSVALSTQALQVKSLPDTHRVLDSLAGSATVEDPGPFRAHVDLFRSDGDRALAILTLWVQEAILDQVAANAGPASTAEPPYEVVARLVGEGPGGATFDLAGPTALRPGAGDLARGADGRRVFQGGVLLPPGSYTVYYAVVPRDASPVRSFRDTLTVPPQDGAGMAVGPIGLASHLERLEGRPGAVYHPPFVLGPLLAVPRQDDAVASGADLSFYYQVSGASIDPIEGRPDLDLEYRFYAEEPVAGGGRSLQPFGNPIHLTHEPDTLQGFSLPLTGWAPGAYRLQVIATDNLNGTSASDTADFRVR